MGFEKRVLSVVRDTLREAESFEANFINGSLFVVCTVKEAVKLETAFLKNFNCGVIMSRMGDESAFDFV